MLFAPESPIRVCNWIGGNFVYSVNGKTQMVGIGRIELLGFKEFKIGVLLLTLSHFQLVAAHFKVTDI